MYSFAEYGLDLKIHVIWYTETKNSVLQVNLNLCSCGFLERLFPATSYLSEVTLKPHYKCQLGFSK